MARKSALVLSDDPIDQAHAAWLKADEELDKAWDDLGKLWSDKTADNLRKGVTREDYKKQLRVVDERMSAMFGWLDRWRYLVLHKDDVVNVPEVEVRAVVIDSLKDKLDGLSFNVNSGVLGTNIAKAIRLQTREESAGDPPFCQDCK